MIKSAHKNANRQLSVLYPLLLAVCSNQSCEALIPSTVKSHKALPSGTVLLPLTPKLDIPHKEYKLNSSQTPQQTPQKDDGLLEKDLHKAVSQETESPSCVQGELKPGPSMISVESGNFDNEEPIDKNDLTLKGTIQIVADDTEYDHEKNTFLGTGNAIAIIAGQNSKLEADMILYDQNNQTIDARGNVRILRNGQLSTGSSFKFKVTSDEYLITNPDTEVQGTTVVARKGYGSRAGLAFRQGTLTMAEPFYINKNAFYGPVSYSEIAYRKLASPEAYVPAKQSFKFKARKMVYERYKDMGNFTMFGGRMMFGNFGIPLPKFTATVGQDNNRVVFPVTPTLTNNLQMGGIHVGPSFNTAVGKDGKLTWTPMIQFGGRNIAGTGSNKGSIGLSGQVAFSNRRMSAHLGYGSVSDLLVADFKYAIWKGLRFQSGINRFLEDGIFGFRRPRLMAELVDTHYLQKQIPFISGVTFRTSAAWAQDNPQLINVTSNFAKLFGNVNQTKTVKNSAFRLQEQISVASQPLFVIGNRKYGARSYIYGGLGLRAYSSGESMIMAQAGPVLDVHLDRLRLQTSYTQSKVRGKTPFIFDRFIQGQRSVYVAGDVRINKYLTVGGGIGYNLNNRLITSRTLTAAIGPEDFKVLLTRETITGQNRFGFDVLYGQPVAFDKLVLKGRADQGQLGGI